MLRKPVAAALVLAAIPLGFGAPAKTSKSLAFATYKEQVGRITLLVGSFPAALCDGDPYIPLQIAVGVRGRGETVVVTAESFHLVDQDGNVYPMASWQEILQQDRAFLFTPQILEAYPLVTGQQFANSFQLPARFFPSPGGGVQVNRVEMESNNYIVDVLYFPAPLAGLSGVLSLQFQAQGLDKQVEVRFEVPLKGKRRAERKH